MEPLVSILIPAFNAQEYVADALRSVISQTWPRKEIIVVNDGSTDRTLEIAQQFASGSVRVVTQENQGAAAARNKAFSLSQGDYIQWLDADDLMAPDKITAQMQLLGQCRGKRTLLSCAWGRFLHRPYQAKFNPTPLWADLSPVEWLLRKMGQDLYMQTATWLASRELAQSAGPWDTRLLGDDDGEYFCRVLLASDGVRFVPNARVYYRASGASSLSYVGHSNRKREAQWISMQLHVRYLRSLEDSERTRTACVKYIQDWMVYFYPESLDIFEQAQELARSMGGEVRVPRLSWKYSWIDKAFGRPLAKRAQVFLPKIKWLLVRGWDKALLRLEGRKLTGSL